jgi:hypothetical protein
MSYRCEITGKISKAHAPLHKVIAITREKVYTKMVKNEETREWHSVECSHGYEPVRELSLSLEGLEIWNNWKPSQREEFLKAKVK